MSTTARTRCHRSPGKGWSLVELVVFLTVVSLLAGVTIPVLLHQIQRARLLNAARETTAVLQVARLSAIRQSRQAQVRLDTTDSILTAFLDEDQDGARGANDRQLVPPYTLSDGVLLKEPGGQTGTDSVDGFQVQGNEAIVVFNPDGTSQAAGALRFADGRSTPNYLEVRLAPRTTAKLEIRKWDGTAWHAQGEGGSTWKWN